MPKTFISVNTQKRLGADLRQAVAVGTSYRELLVRLKATMDTMVDGTDYTALETEFGLPSGTGEATYNLVAGATAQTTNASVTALLTRLG